MSAGGIRPAIVVVGYNRPDSLLRVLASVAAATYTAGDITLVVSLDRSPVTEKLAKIAGDFEWNHGSKVIRTFPERQGLRRHILQCGDLSYRYGAVIILEDDVTVAPNFFEFAEDALAYYGDDDRIAGISLYSHQVNEFARRYFMAVEDGHDVYFAQFSCSWGQCWSRSQWLDFKLWYRTNSGLILVPEDVPRGLIEWPETSWAKYFVRYMVSTSKFYVIPRTAYSTNNGDAGTHNHTSSAAFQVPLQLGCTPRRFVEFEHGTKYDAHFGRVVSSSSVGLQLPQGSLVFDPYGTRDGVEGSRFLVSSRRLPYKIVHSFGLRLRPIEMNVLCGVSGTGLRLYDTSVPASPLAFSAATGLDRISYEHRTLAWREALRFGLRGLITAMVNRILRPVSPRVRRAIVDFTDSLVSVLL